MTLTREVAVLRDIPLFAKVEPAKASEPRRTAAPGVAFARIDLWQRVAEAGALFAVLATAATLRR
jgi:hypothetical protein